MFGASLKFPARPSLAYACLSPAGVSISPPSPTPTRRPSTWLSRPHYGRAPPPAPCPHSASPSYSSPCWRPTRQLPPGVSTPVSWTWILTPITPRYIAPWTKGCGTRGGWMPPSGALTSGGRLTCSMWPAPSCQVSCVAFKSFLGEGGKRSKHRESLTVQDEGQALR